MWEAAIVPGAAQPAPFGICEDDNYDYFVHGATLKSGENFDIIDSNRGGGDDLGGGFYTFKLCEEDHHNALKKARDRSLNQKKTPKSPNGYGRSARIPYEQKQGYLIFLRIPKTRYASLRKLTLGTLGEHAVYRPGERKRRLGYDVAIGFMLWGDGKNCMYKEPKQYKFEEHGIDALEILGKQLQHD